MRTSDFQSRWHTRRRLLAGGLAVMLGSCRRPQPDLRPGERGVVARVTDGDLLALDTGLRTRLAEIEAPSPYGDGAPYGEEARDLLEREAVGRTAQLYYGGLSRDRYERALAHVFIEDELGRTTWLNGLMIAQGAARVRTYPDNSAKVRDLYALETEAREAGKGLWAIDDYRIRTPTDWPAAAEPRAFTLVEGSLDSIDPPERYGVLRRTGAGLALAPPAGLTDTSAPPGLTPGTRIRLRGRTRIHDDASVTVDFSHWAQIEILPA